MVCRVAHGCRLELHCHKQFTPLRALIVKFVRDVRRELVVVVQVVVTEATRPPTPALSHGPQLELEPLNKGINTCALGIFP